MLFAEKLTAEILAPVPHRHWTFSIPRVLRGIVERDRRLLGLLSQTAYASILKTFQALFERTDVRPGCVASLRTFRAYGANFNLHAHALVSDGVFSAEGDFLPLPALDTAAVMEVFRRLLLQRLCQAERLSENFMQLTGQSLVLQKKLRYRKALSFQPLATAPVRRQTDTRRRTIPTSRRKREAPGRAC